MLSYMTGIDPMLARAAATLGASPWQQFRQIYLPLLVPGLAMASASRSCRRFRCFRRRCCSARRPGRRA